MSVSWEREVATVRLMLKKGILGVVRGALGALPIAALLVCTASGADAPPATDSAPAAAEKGESAIPATAAEPGTDKAQVSPNAAPPRRIASPYAPDRFAGRAGLYYQLNWGIDSISVRLVESGELVRFSYRVVDPKKARVLNDKQAEARLDDPKAGVSLVVPTMEKIGQLRQTTTPEAGRSYWTTFSNKGRRVARGDRVDVVIGAFKASNLVVD